MRTEKASIDYVNHGPKIYQRQCRHEVQTRIAVNAGPCPLGPHAASLSFL